MKAVDVHVHPPTSPALREAAARRNAEQTQQMRQYFRRAEPDLETPEQYVELYEKHDIVGVLLPSDNRQPGDTESPDPNDWVHEVVQRAPNRWIPFCSVNPNRGEQAIKDLERAAGEFDAKGLKLLPTGMNFFANEEQYYPLWEKAQELELVILTHSGHNGVGSSLAGGGGRKQWYSNPSWWGCRGCGLP